MQDWDWARIGKAVVARRSELGMRTTKRLAERTELSSRLLGDIENARRASYAADTLIRIEFGLGWEIGSLEAIGRGGEPTERADAMRLIGRIGTRALQFTHKVLEDQGDLPDEELWSRWLRGRRYMRTSEIEFADRYGLSEEQAHAAFADGTWHHAAGYGPDRFQEQLRRQVERNRELAAREGVIPLNPSLGDQALTGEESQDPDAD